MYYKTKGCKTSINTNSAMLFITRQPNNNHICTPLTKAQIQMILSHQKMKERVKIEGTSVGKILYLNCIFLFNI
jgi:hypothetical protein